MSRMNWERFSVSCFCIRGFLVLYQVLLEVPMTRPLYLFLQLYIRILRLRSGMNEIASSHQRP